MSRDEMRRFPQETQSWEQLSGCFCARTIYLLLQLQYQQNNLSEST